ncbi:MAG: hypothetical protein WBA13_15005 [Microcoleaceae cyanobacterium]
MNKLTEETLKNNKVFQEEWYHSIELLPGVFTNGKKHKNIALTRALLQGCEIKGTKCLDVGAQDCLTSMLLERRAALRVVAQDIQRNDDHIDLLKNVLNANFEYLSGCQLSELRSITKNLSIYPFDIVVFSGVLYHMLDPLTGLALMRGLLRNGGLFILETSAFVSDSMTAHFNANGQFFSGTNYWQVSLECLDYMLRLLRLKPIDLVYFCKKSTKICRISIVCQAIDHALAEKNDKWISKIDKSIQFSELLDWKELETGLPQLSYYSNRNDLIFRDETESLNIYKTVLDTDPLKIDNANEQLCLKLDSIF